MGAITTVGLYADRQPDVSVHFVMPEDLQNGVTFDSLVTTTDNYADVCLWNSTSCPSSGFAICFYNNSLPSAAETDLHNYCVWWNAHGQCMATWAGAASSYQETCQNDCWGRGDDVSVSLYQICGEDCSGSPPFCLSCTYTELTPNGACNSVDSVGESGLCISGRGDGC